MAVRKICCVKRRSWKRRMVVEDVVIDRQAAFRVRHHGLRGDSRAEATDGEGGYERS